MSKLLKDLERLSVEISFTDFKNHNDPKFENWEAKTSRTIKKIFGENSPEWTDFSKIQFWYHYAGETYEGMPKSEYDKMHFQKGLKKAELLLEDLVEDAKIILDSENLVQEKMENSERKIFISHSTKDEQLGKEIKNLVQLIGVPQDKIFFTSGDGFGIRLGDDWTETLKREIIGEVIVLSIVTQNYLQSQMCLCELGAAWVLSKKNIPIIDPSIKFDKLNEILRKNQGFEITKPVKWTSLKKQLEDDFGLPSLPGDKWEDQRDAILVRIKQLLETIEDEITDDENQS